MDKENIEVEMQVDHHPSGRFTLKVRPRGSSLWTDLEGDLFANTDQESFYRAAIREMANITRQGFVIVSVHDTAQ